MAANISYGDKYPCGKFSEPRYKFDLPCSPVDLNNRSSLKLTYNPKAGSFKGSFWIYATESQTFDTELRVSHSATKFKLKKYKADVIGVVVDGKGVGQASVKKPTSGPWTVTVE